MELILNFITPGPLTERCKFSARVISSWITLGIVLDFILVLTNFLNAKNAEELFVVPLSICIFGLIGLAISSIRGESLECPGWYWYLFPLVSYIVFAFWLTIGFLALVFGFLGFSGITLPTPQKAFRQKTHNQTIDDWIQKNSDQRGNDFVKNNPKFKPKNPQEEAIYQEVKKSEQTLGEIISKMTEKQFNFFIKMLLRMLGITFL